MQQMLKMIKIWKTAVLERSEIWTDLSCITSMESYRTVILPKGEYSSSCWRKVYHTEFSQNNTSAHLNLRTHNISFRSLASVFRNFGTLHKVVGTSFNQKLVSRINSMCDTNVHLTTTRPLKDCRHVSFFLGIISNAYPPHPKWQAKPGRAIFE